MLTGLTARYYKAIRPILFGLYLLLSILINLGICPSPNQFYSTRSEQITYCVNFLPRMYAKNVYITGIISLCILESLLSYRPSVYNEIARQLDVKIEPRHIPWFVCQLAEKIDIFLGKLGKYHKHLHICGETGHDIWCDTSKAKKDFGYEPKISLPEGIKLTIASCRELGLIDEK